MKSGRIVSGASTITMQVVRLARLNRPRTFPEKLIEVILASGLELISSKKQILRLYAAHAPFGGNVVGLEAAAWRYFGRQPAQLSWAETATLAVLPNAPALIHPGRNRDLLRKKRDHLLLRLYQTGIIDSLTYTLSCRENLPDAPYPLPQNAPHLLTYLKHEMKAGGRIFSSIDAPTQSMVKNVLERNHLRLAANHIYDGAVMIIDNHANEVIAYMGNISDNRVRDKGRYVDVIQAPRSTGSILKPLLYASLIEKGEILPTQLVQDVPLRLGGFAPQNYSRSYHGAVPASQALARSLNIPAVHMLRQYGVSRFYYKLKNLGMTSLFRPSEEYGLSLILGGAEGTLWEICTIYAGFAESISSFFYDRPARGQPRIIINQLSSVDQDRKYRFRPGATWLTLSAMLEVSRPDLEQFWQNFASSRPVAWKTGTSFGNRDAWAIGVTPEYTVGVWVGNADGEGRPDLAGLNSAAPILFDIFYLLPPTSWFEKPESDLEQIDVCSSSGFRPGPFCKTREKTYIPFDSEAGTTCPLCRLVQLDPTLTYRVNRSCDRDMLTEPVKWFVLPPAVELYYSKKHPEYLPLPPVHPGCPGEELDPFSLIHPAPGSAILVPVELNGEQGRTVLKAAHRRPNAILYWHIDDNYMGLTKERHELAISPSPGEHKITLVDDQGMMVIQTVRIVSAGR